MADVPVIVDGVEDFDEVPINAEGPNYDLFVLTEEALRSIGESDWDAYDEVRSDSPLAMFFYFLRKTLRIQTADETIRYRYQHIGAVEAARRSKLLTWQAKCPYISVPNLEDMEQDLNKFKRIQPH
ncbi:hypothetical protein PHMEG_00021376 [Phytophthora megakarya]|uniref:Uncharacterized protein n=1 Tax=Phytophthora megakarya TaxID=4795 RepID=A0A225VNP4_9STRA|nr:hypothetical protein PHMEG_00021376 [Phytophthora megakarya]